MKKSDIAMIVLLASIAMLTAFFVAGSIPALKVTEKGTKVDSIEKISSGVVDPDPKVFNSNAVNPTVETVIGNKASTQ